MQAIHASSGDIGPEELAKLDLNLLVAFDAMARERSVTAAAARVGVTQSAMSHALRRLRELLGDALLVRGKSGMMLTPRAEALVVPLRSGLVTLGRALRAPDAFDPSRATRSFCIASLDLIDVVVLPSVLERIRREAPGIDLSVVPVESPQLLDRLETGEVDAAILPQMDEGKTARQLGAAAPGLLRRVLFRDEFMCFLRADHPALRGQAVSRDKRKRPLELSVKSYAALSHVVISTSQHGRSVIDDLLEERGLTRRIALRIPHFYSALSIVSTSDLILTGPTGLARVELPGAQGRIVAVAPPLRLPTHSVNLVWHERFSNDAGQTWLRGLIADTARSVLRDPPPLIAAAALRGTP